MQKGTHLKHVNRKGAMLSSASKQNHFMILWNKTELRRQHYRRWGKSAQQDNHMKCLCTSAHNMGNKERIRSLCAVSQGCDLIGITDMQWDGLHDWNTAMSGTISLGSTGQDRTGQRKSSPVWEKTVGVWEALPRERSWAIWELIC